MKRQLTDVHKGMLVRRGIVQTVQLNDAIAHKGDGRKEGGDRSSGRKLGSLGVGQVSRFETLLNEGEGLSKGHLADANEGIQANDLVVLRGIQRRRPKIGEGLETGLGHARICRHEGNVIREILENEREQFRFLRLGQQMKGRLEEGLQNRPNLRPALGLGKQLGIHWLVDQIFSFVVAVVGIAIILSSFLLVAIVILGLHSRSRTEQMVSEFLVTVT
mmetsp:Transcript_2983/g.8653  ORF Transcript_2983/g.8653 Transcript_2983/m.8653 type:complete len:218 (-) Transcript_2983:823-1476(-)